MHLQKDLKERTLSLRLKTTTTTNTYTQCGATGTPMHCWWESKMVLPLWELVWQFHIKLNIHFPTVWQSHTLVFLYPRGMKPCYTKTCSQSLKQLYLRSPSPNADNTSNILQLVNSKATCGRSIQWNSTKQWKETN